MKHLILPVFILLTFVSILFAQEERKVMVEVFTNSHCPSCPNAHYVLESYLEGSNGDKISYIFYHMIYPYSDDPLYAESMEDSDARNNYYLPVPFTPQGWFDSFHQDGTTTWQSNLDTLVTKDSPLRIELSGSKNTTQFNVSAKLTRTGDITDSDLVLHFVVVEDLYFDGRNSISNHKHVMRKMLPTPDGESFTIGLNEVKDFAQTIDLNSLWDADSLSIVVFVQSTASKTIYQSETISYLELTITGVYYEVEPATEFALSQNFPNPFNPTTKIKYTIPTSPFVPLLTKEMGWGEVVTLKVYDVLGNEIATLINEQQQPGTYEVEFNIGSSIKNLVSGVYFYQLKTGSFIESKKMILLK